ncbi:Uncharacterized protein dnl_29320 [Desulfonema limicola]|uniref:Uncharacterized protein n=1 Tax=Desulfonema limicola TaxID=45656 RepID=A0A975GGW0_9BACT|nr:hypothetical protein [Desulfonema limicola]QTA80622.1 Uncharacterized protein dnl_29320 [Desulfonema limicola]
MSSIKYEERTVFRIASEISDIASSGQLSRKNKLAMLEALRDTLNETISELKLAPPDEPISLQGVKPGWM